MNKKILQKITAASYTTGVLDPEKVSRVTRLLKRKELKTYLRALRRMEQQRKVLIATPVELSQKEKKNFQSLYPRKEVTFIADPLLIAGVKITKYDLTFETSLAKTLQELTRSVSNTYE